MRKKMEWNWEQLDAHTNRAKVIGGWLVRNEYVLPKEKLCCVSTTFVPDRDHEWTIVPALKEVEAPKSTVRAADFAPK